MKVKVAQLCQTLCNPTDYTVHGILHSRILVWVAFPFSRGSNPGLLHCRWILSQLSHKESPRILEQVAYPFCRGSSRPRNPTRVSCIADGFFYQLIYQGSPWSLEFTPIPPVPVLSQRAPSCLSASHICVSSCHSENSGCQQHQHISSFVQCFSTVDTFRITLHMLLP